MLIAAFALIGAAAIGGAAVTSQPVAFVAAGTIACALLYVWEFALTRPVTVAWWTSHRGSC